MSPKDTFGNRVWKGDRRTVAEARKDFERAPKEHLLKFAVALYSFRTKRKYADELLGLLSLLMQEAERLIQAPHYEPDALRFADMADVLSTHLEWIARFASLTKDERSEIRTLVSKLCSKGVSATLLYDYGSGHTRRLLTLTKTRVLVEQGYRQLAWLFLRGELDDIARVADPRQRARVYAKAGLLCRKLGRHRVGFSLGLRACAVSRIPLHTRVRRIGMLVGVDM